jgi:hypothetical protein
VRIHLDDRHALYCAVVSSSGLIYAGIVGAWAVYLVPVWLRREEQLNEARQKARYAAAIRTLGRTEQFEKRWLTEGTLAATGTDGLWRPQAQPKKKPATKQTTVVKTAERRPAPTTSAATSSTTSAAEQRRTKPTVTARISRQQPAAAPAPRTTSDKDRNAARKAVRHRGILLMRRRRVVAFLFTLATTGALVSATLGIAYIWAMLAPAALFSLYIVNIRRDERLRAEERYRRRQAVLAAERRRERERQRTQPEPAEHYEPRPQDYRRAANG